ncbi:MAG: DUF3142 domain-containing protein [Gammaproteobacteria bacterium]
MKYNLPKCVLAVLLVILCACKPAKHNTLAHDAYIWQHQWTPALNAAIQTASPWLDRWRVLGAELTRRGQFSPLSVDLQTLIGGGKSVVTVIRINGQLHDWDPAQIAKDSVNVVKKWRQLGINVTGLEIDHDCATRRLPDYAQFLAKLRQDTAGLGLSLSITALPTWLESPELLNLLKNVDEAVLQVHSVVDPQHGLFDAQQAKDWVEKFSAISPIAFRVALPTYGSRIAWDKDKRIAAVESETPIGLETAEAQELIVRPQDVAVLLDRWREQPPSRLTGISWFRLPTRDDRRAWSLETWQAVIEGRKIAAKISAYASPGPFPGLLDIFVSNDSDIDAPFPEKIQLLTGQSCEASDALGDYRIVQASNEILFHLSKPAILKARHQSAVGWIRCPKHQVKINAYP